MTSLFAFPVAGDELVSVSLDTRLVRVKLNDTLYGTSTRGRFAAWLLDPDPENSLRYASHAVVWSRQTPEDEDQPALFLEIARLGEWRVPDEIAEGLRTTLTGDVSLPAGVPAGEDLLAYLKEHEVVVREITGPHVSDRFVTYELTIDGVMESIYARDHLKEHRGAHDATRELAVAGHLVKVFFKKAAADI